MGQQEEALKRAIFCIICMMTRVHGSARLLLWIVSLVVIPGRFDFREARCGLERCFG